MDAHRRRTHDSGQRTLLAFVGLGTAAVAGAAVAVALASPPVRPRAGRTAPRPYRRSLAGIDGSYAAESEGSGLFV